VIAAASSPQSGLPQRCCVLPLCVFLAQTPFWVIPDAPSFVILVNRNALLLFLLTLRINAVFHSHCRPSTLPRFRRRRPAPGFVALRLLYENAKTACPTLRLALPQPLC